MPLNLTRTARGAMRYILVAIVALCWTPATLFAQVPLDREGSHKFSRIPSSAWKNHEHRRPLGGKCFYSVYLRRSLFKADLTGIHCRPGYWYCRSSMPWFHSYYGIYFVRTRPKQHYFFADDASEFRPYPQLPLRKRPVRHKVLLTLW